MSHLFRVLIEMTSHFLEGILGIPGFLATAGIIGAIIVVPLFLAFIPLVFLLIIYNVGLDYYSMHWSLGVLYFICLSNVLILPIIEKIRKNNYKSTYGRHWRKIWKMYSIQWESIILSIAFWILVIACAINKHTFVKYMEIYFG